MYETENIKELVKMFIIAGGIMVLLFIVLTYFFKFIFLRYILEQIVKLFGYEKLVW